LQVGPFLFFFYILSAYSIVSFSPLKEENFSVCVCACACARARVRACACACACACVRERERDSMMKGSMRELSVIYLSMITARKEIDY
jgi:hypothetical protein